MEFKQGGGGYIVKTLPQVDYADMLQCWSEEELFLWLLLFLTTQHVQKYGSAFLNSGGGSLCMGVADDGEYLCEACVGTVGQWQL